MVSLNEARKHAEALAEAMRPFCERVEIAGSIRREKAEVKDLEIVAIPRWEDRPGSDLFGTPEPLNLLHRWALSEQTFVRWIKPGTSEIVDWEPKSDGKYWRGLLPIADGFKLDLFLASADNFGAIFLIRTGSADFSEAVVTHAKRIGKPCREGRFTIEGEPAATPEEADVFALLNLPYIEPRLRTGPEALRG